jgi:hypothetical protein
MLQSKPADRPSLSQISFHPFLNSPFIPKSIPSSATHTAPEFGGHNGTSHQKAFERPALPKSNSLRRPFGAKDPNVHNTVPNRAEKKKPPPLSANPLPMMDVQGAVKSAWRAVVNNVTSPSRGIQKSGKFQVFDETNHRNSHKEEINERDIVSRTANLGIRSMGDKPSTNPNPPAP